MVMFFMSGFVFYFILKEYKIIFSMILINKSWSDDLIFFKYVYFVIYYYLFLMIIIYVCI